MDQPDDCESEFSAGHPAAPHDDDHGSGHGHSHDHGLSAPADGGATGTAKHRKRLILALCITLTVVLVQFVGALISGSLSLLADTGHMLTDVPLRTGLTPAVIVGPWVSVALGWGSLVALVVVGLIARRGRRTYETPTPEGIGVS